MDQESSLHARLTDLSIPLEGIENILSGWSGKGTLYEAMAAVSGDDTMERAWTEQDIRSRADRILVEHVRADIDKWPRSVDEWLPHLPVTSRAEVLVSSTPRGRVDWRETSRRFGWPARSYVTRRRHREIADVTVTTLAWTVERLEAVVRQARTGRMLPEIEPALDDPLIAAREALSLTQIPETLPRPDRHDLDALLTSGRPWSYVEAVTSKIVRSETDLLWFAEQMLSPDPDLRWRLFHLAALGHLLSALRKHQARISWRAPMGAGSSGPHFVARLPDGTNVEVWFETSGANRHYGGATAGLYSKTVTPIHGAERGIGADLGVFIPSRKHALLFEVKFSWYGPYISRNGFHQAAAYVLDAGDHWERVWSYILGPEERVCGTSRVSVPQSQGDAALGATSIAGLDALISDFLMPGANMQEDPT
ncbi:MAG: hypothetical protein U0R67_05760 [Micropruina glycogenica]